MPRLTHDTLPLRTLLWEGERVEINLQDHEGALHSLQSIKRELEDELSDGMPLEFRRASSGSRILASSWAVAVQDAEEEIIVSLKSGASGPASPAVYTPQLQPQQSPWFAPSPPLQPSAVDAAMGGEAEEKGMSAGRTVRKARSFVPQGLGEAPTPLRHYRSFAQPSLAEQKDDAPTNTRIPPSSPPEAGIRRPFGAALPSLTSSACPSPRHLYSPPPTPSPRSRDRSFSPPRHSPRAHSIAFDTPPASRRSSLIEAASASDMAKAARGLSHSKSASESLSAVFATRASFGDFFDNFCAIEREGKILEETFNHTNTPPPIPSVADYPSRRWSSASSSTASEESLVTPAELDVAHTHQMARSKLDKINTPSVPTLEKALQALQTGYTQTHGEEKVDGSPRRARTCVDLHSVYSRKTPPPPLPFLTSSADPLDGNRPGTPIALRTRPLPSVQLPPPPPPPTRNPSKTILRPSSKLGDSASASSSSTPSASTSRSGSRSRV
ncbi:hypothetical protein BCR35DRAFT_328093 [Leucosporidium creatinivorum]|uniref:Uncharacterized protein n=1 Tax=Leucosporidium creatinivorum TaxID=106004 RepID=A0A1Y2G284_9BASI|nr:hypothetical protein BCR35DRAFT_328093 [Leucosporidium creatinivorum]